MRLERGIVLAAALLLGSWTALDASAAANQAPTATVSVSAPSLNAPATLTLSATASDVDGTVASVQFFRGGSTAIGPVLTTPPYTYTWTNVAAGTYAITAKPIDNLGKAGTSNTVSVTVITVTTVITSPAAGSTVTAGAVSASGTYTGAAGTTVLVTGGANDTVVASASNGSFSAVVEVVEGTNLLEVQVARPDGTSEIVTSTFNGVKPPVVAITEPTSRGPYSIPTTVTVTADAATNQGTISKVEFLDNSSLFATITTPPYTTTRSLTTTGSHAIVARAYNSANLSTDSTALVLSATSQPPTVAITSPTNGSTFKAGTAITVTATASDPDGTVERVDYLFGTVPTGSTVAPYTATWTPTSAGTYQLVARARDNAGNTGDSPQVTVTITPNAPPTVQLTAPASNISAIAPATVALAATAADSDGTIARVEFLSNGGVIGTATSSPYQFSWTNVAAGTYVVAAKAYDNNNASTVSASRTVTVTNPPPNQPPTVALTAPANNATFTAPVDILLTATASDPDAGGSVAQVEFLDGTTVLATITTPPYQYTWANQTLGAHTITARATDNVGATSTASVNVTVNGSVVTISQPANGYRVPAPASYNIVANVSTTSGTFISADIMDGQTVIGSVPSINLPSAGFSFPYSNVAAGTHVHTIRALHSNGSTVMSAPVTVDVYTPPSVTLSSPTQNEYFIAPAAVGLVAKPSGFALPVSVVQFFAGDQMVGQVSTPPYEILWNGVAAGAYQVRAVATDSAGNTATATSAITVTAQPVLQLTPGQDGSNVDDDQVHLSGHIDGPANTSVLVNGREAAIDASGNWFMNAVPLTPGANSISIVAKTIGAADTTRTISINSTAAQPFELVITPQEGLPPLIVNASLRSRGALVMARVEFDADSDGTPDATVTQFENGQALAAFSYGGPGLYNLTARAFNASGALLYSATRTILVSPASLVASRVGNVYRRMVGRLLAADATAAVAAVAQESRERYSAVFSALGSDLPVAAAQLGRAEVRAMSDRIAEIAVTRETAQGTRVYPVYLMKGDDGLWRIEGM